MLQQCSSNMFQSSQYQQGAAVREPINAELLSLLTKHLPSKDFEYLRVKPAPVVPSPALQLHIQVADQPGNTNTRQELRAGRLSLPGTSRRLSSDAGQCTAGVSVANAVAQAAAALNQRQPSPASRVQPQKPTAATLAKPAQAQQHRPTSPSRPITLLPASKPGQPQTGSQHPAIRSGTAAAAVREHVRRDPKLLPNPVEDERQVAQKRAQAAAAMAAESRIKAQARQQQAAQQERNKAERLQRDVAQESKAALQQADEPVTLPDPAAPLIHSHTGPPAAPAASLEDPGLAGASCMSARAPAAPPPGLAAAGDQPVARPRGRSYDRPWARHMVPPGTAPALLPPQDSGGSASGQPMLPPPPDAVMLDTGPGGPAAGG
ncbi:hypothetical protein V8C86DRAFT_298957 [Haematococcus lacustris]